MEAYVERAKGLAEYSASRAQELYGAAKAAAPPALSPALEQLEAALEAYGAPVAAKLSEAAPKLIAGAEQRLGALKGLGASSAEQFQALRAEYLARVEALVAEVRTEGLGPYYSKAAEGVTQAVGEARAKLGAVDFSPYMQRVQAALETLTGLPAVQRLSEAGAQSFELAKAKYLQAHDVLVADPRYGAAVTKGGELLSKAAASPYVLKAEEVAAPYVERALANKYVAGVLERTKPLASAVLDHLTPVPAQ